MNRASLRLLSSIVASFGALLLPACTEGLPPLRLERVNPSSAEAQYETSIEILGAGFAPVIHANHDDSDKSYVDARFEGHLSAIPLVAVTYVSPTSLKATVPAGMPPGVHDLVVDDPRGRRGVLRAAFTVVGAVDATVEASGGDGGADAGIDASDDAGADGPHLDGAAVDAPREAGAPTTIEPMLADPFGDGTSFSFVFEYAGKIYLGPNAAGTGAVRVNPDGSDPTPIAFSFAADVTGNASQNQGTAPYTSIGRAGCAANTLACGPDNEDGRGLFAAGNIGGSEWLVVGGARTAGDLDYVYMTSDTDTTLSFRYVDLSTRMGPQTKGFSSMRVVGNRVYLGFPDTGGKRPYLIALKETPSAPGLDVSTDAEAENLAAHLMPNIGNSAATAMIDAMIDFNDRVYLFNNGGCVRATVAQPASYELKPTDWVDCTPSAAAYSSKTAITTNKVRGIEPADKAFPQLAIHEGRLYAGRNTTAGPQLWVCDPAPTGNNVQCDPDDWMLVAPNTQGDAALTQFNRATNAKLTLLVATPTALYVGFDNVQGIVLLRSTTATPTTGGDFSGEGDCNASAHATSCAGIGGFGLGDASNSRIFDAMAASFGGTSYLYLTAGSGVGPVEVFRVAD